MYTPLIKKRTGRYGNNHWLVFSPKLKREVNLFSDLELDQWVIVETDPSVLTFCEQPFEASVEGQEETSIFDLWVKKKGGSELYIEIKYDNDIEKEDVKKQIAIQKKWCELNGKEHLVRTDKDIRKNVIYLENLKEIIPYVLNSNTPVEIDRFKITEKLKEGKSTLAVLHNSLNITLPRIYEAICCLVYSGDIEADIDKQHLGLQTEVWINGEKNII